MCSCVSDRFIVCLPTGATALLPSHQKNPNVKAASRALLELLWDSLIVRMPLDNGVKFGK